MRSPNASDHKYANDIYLSQLMDRRKELSHLRERLKKQQESDSIFDEQRRKFEESKKR